MPLEIERKFLVTGDSWQVGEPVRMRQGYLSRDPACNVRVRVAGETAWLTIKGATDGISRAEFEYDIPVADAEALLAICDGPLIEKERYFVPVGDHVFEVDEFFGDNTGLVLAEIELSSEDEVFERPDWLGQEVSGEKRYYNLSLSVTPFKKWERKPSGRPIETP